MPHLITNRPRLTAVASKSLSTPAHFAWETVNAIVYKVGGLIFIAGSVLFFPRFSAWEDLGAWLFFGGSILYLVVTVHDFLETRKFWRRFASDSAAKQVELVTAASYLIGTLMFTFGSLFFLSWWGWYQTAAWLFVVGSLLFAVGAVGNVLQIIQAPNTVCMQLLNLTAVSFLVGSTLFVVGSIPYLWRIASPVDRHILFAYLAWQYLAGSVLFFLGGLFNYARMYTANRQRKEMPNPEALFADFIEREVEELRGSEARG
ncbi:MAG TPA: YrhK family protein [Gammaproteobacteria bacterium]|nr:YrhK family protein [Gammaproteobacteria bacterium]